jgi:hypothetical protein
MARLTFNIETVGDPNLPKILQPNDDDVKTGNAKDPEKLAAIRAEKLAKMQEKLSLKPLTGIPICLATKIDEEPIVVTTGAPHKICLAFADEIQQSHDKGTPLQLISFNGKQFDLPYLAITFARLGQRLPLGRLDDYLYPYNHEHHLDVRSVLSLNGEGTLGDWSVRFGLKEPFGKGEFVGQWWKEGNIDNIKRHCADNVDRTFALAKQLAASWGI